MTRTAIVVATHANCYPLETCLKGHTEIVESPEDLIFVDNGSGGELAELARRWVPEATILTRTENGFFCGGYNTGLQCALDRGYDYILIVNADTEVVNTGYLGELVSVLNQEPQAAFVGPRVANGDAETIQNTILSYPWLWRYCFDWLARAAHPNRSAMAKEICRVEFLNGVCVLCRGTALKEFGLLDEDMGGYVEDADWSWRAMEAGWKSVYKPVPSIVHYQEESEYQFYSLKSFMLRRNHVYWHWKNRRYFQALGFIILPGILSVLRAVSGSLRGQAAEAHWHYVKRFWQAVWGIVRNLPKGPWFGPPSGDF